MLYPLEQVRGPIYTKEILHQMLLLNLPLPTLDLFQINFMAHAILLHLEIIDIVSQGPCSMTSGSKGRMVFLSLIFGVWMLVTWILPLQQFGYSRRRRGCVSVLISTKALHWSFLFLFLPSLMGTKVFQLWNNNYLKMLVPIRAIYHIYHQYFHLSSSFKCFSVSFTNHMQFSLSTLSCSMSNSFISYIHQVIRCDVNTPSWEMICFHNQHGWPPLSSCFC